MERFNLVNMFYYQKVLMHVEKCLKKIAFLPKHNIKNYLIQELSQNINARPLKYKNSLEYMFQGK